MFDTGEEGVEPPLTVLETALLPLEDSPKKLLVYNTTPAVISKGARVNILRISKIKERRHAFKTAYTLESCLWTSPRPISSSQLHTLLHFHLCPIDLVVFKGTYFL